MNPLPPTQDELLAAVRKERAAESPRPASCAALITGEQALLLQDAEEHLLAAARGLALMRQQTTPGLLAALARDVDQLQEIGFGAFSDAMTQAGFPIPRE